MNRVRIALAAIIAGLSLAAADVAVAGQAAQDGPQSLKPILSGKKYTPPIKGAAAIDFIKPITKREKDLIITTIEVKNTSNAPIGRLTVDETWYDKSGGTIPGSKGVINGLLQPGETGTVRIETPYNPKMNSNNWNFSHANGAIKPRQVKSFEGADANTAVEQKAPPQKKAPAKK